MGLQDAFTASREIRRVLAGMLEQLPDAGPTAAEILRLLNPIEEYLHQTAPTGEAVDQSDVSVQGERGVPIEYRIVVKNGAGTLFERRLSGRSQPQRCPQHVYSATAKALAKSESPVEFEDLMEVARRHEPHLPADFQVRVCIRFWMSLNPPLVERARSKYRAAHPGRFEQEAKKAWENLLPKTRRGR